MGVITLNVECYDSLCYRDQRHAKVFSCELNSSTLNPVFSPVAEYKVVLSRRTRLRVEMTFRLWEMEKCEVPRDTHYVFAVTLTDSAWNRKSRFLLELKNYHVLQLTAPGGGSFTELVLVPGNYLFSVQLQFNTNVGLFVEC